MPSPLDIPRRREPQQMAMFQTLFIGDERSARADYERFKQWPSHLPDEDRTSENAEQWHTAYAEPGTGMTEPFNMNRSGTPSQSRQWVIDRVWDAEGTVDERWPLGGSDLPQSRGDRSGAINRDLTASDLSIEHSPPDEWGDARYTWVDPMTDDEVAKVEYSPYEDGRLVIGAEVNPHYRGRGFSQRIMADLPFQGELEEGPWHAGSFTPEGQRAFGDKGVPNDTDIAIAAGDFMGDEDPSDYGAYKEKSRSFRVQATRGQQEQARPLMEKFRGPSPVPERRSTQLSMDLYPEETKVNADKMREVLKGLKGVV